MKFFNKKDYNNIENTFEYKQKLEHFNSYNAVKYFKEDYFKGRKLDYDLVNSSNGEIIAKIGDTSNIGSIKLHESFGFVKCGHLHNVGYKFGKYIDVLIYEKDLRDEDPASSYMESEDEDQERALL